MYEVLPNSTGGLQPVCFFPLGSAMVSPMYAYERWCTSLPRYASTAGGGAGSAVWPLPAAARPAGGCGWPGLRHHALSRRSEPCSAAGSGVWAARRGWRSPPCGGACQEIARRWSALQEQQRGSVVLFVSARQMCEVCAERLPALLGAVLMGGARGANSSDNPLERTRREWIGFRGDRSSWSRACWRWRSAWPRSRAPCLPSSGRHLHCGRDGPSG